MTLERERELRANGELAMWWIGGVGLAVAVFLASAFGLAVLFPSLAGL